MVARTANLERMNSTLPILGERSNQLAGTMSGGQQQMLSVGVARMSSPRLLLLDEPSLGLAPSLGLTPSLVKEMFGLTRALVTREKLSYGGVFVVGSLLWGVAFDGFQPSRYDLIGATVCAIGVGIIIGGAERNGAERSGTMNDRRRCRRTTPRNPATSRAEAAG